MMKIFPLVAAALALSVTQAPAFAAAPKATTRAAPKPPAKSVADAPISREQQEHGMQTFSLLASAMQSKNVPDDVKSALMLCVYENSVGKISDTVDKVLADNPGKVDRSKPEQMLSVMARICGYEPPASAAAAPAAPQSSPPTSAPAGR